MYASLRFPDVPKGRETPLNPDAFGVPSLLSKIQWVAREKKALLTYLPLACSDPVVLDYRAEFATELFSSEKLQEILSEFCSLHRDPPAPSGTEETERLQTIAHFEAFSERFDEFRKKLDGFSPESDGAKRFVRFCKTYGDSAEYRTLKGKASELLRALNFEKGISLEVGGLTEREGTALLHRDPNPYGVWSLLGQARNFFEDVSLEPMEELSRPYTPVESAVLTGVLRKTIGILPRMEEFFTLYSATETEAFLRLRDEGTFYLAMNRLYREGNQRGYSLCRPRFREEGFYGELLGLNFPSQEEGVGSADYLSSPIAPVTVVCGPDSEAYLWAVGFAHLCASAGCLVFAQKAEISPINRGERDLREQVCVEGLNEHSLCLCANLFDVMLPRQEEAAVKEVIRSLSERSARSVIRICSKSNLSALQKQADAGQISPCTLLQAGTDRTLEDLLQRYNLTAKSLNLEEEEK